MSTSAPPRAALEALLVRITETPAPTFEEEARGDLVARLLADAGWSPERDGVGNVIADIPGRGPTVILAAHLDTVFPAETDVAVRRDDDRLRAPGIGDNSASLAVLLHYASRAAEEPADSRPRLIVAATVGEEGVGDLRGARRLVADRSADAFVALDGHLGTIVASPVGSKRFDVAFRARGGHSWGDYPAPSAVHALGEAIHGLLKIRVPSDPRSSLNVGEVEGGNAINAIAERARFNLDLRSLDPDTLAGLEREARRRIRRTANRTGTTVEITQIGDRPASKTDNRALVAAAEGALRSVSVGPRLAASSTDANAALAAGIPAIAFGVYRGGDAHRLSEWVDPASLETGYRALRALIGRLG